METWTWVVIVVLAVALAAALTYVLAVQRRSGQLKKRFGPEYDRAVDQAGSRQRAENELSDIAKRRDKLEIKPLAEDARRGYAADWERVQRQFVDEPEQAVAAADDLIVRVMRDRGYPVDEFDDRADFVAADYPEVASHYRSAHSIRGRDADATTEDHRQAFVHYRALFDEMLGDSGRTDVAGDRAHDPHDPHEPYEADKADETHKVDEAHEVDETHEHDRRR